MSEAKLKIVGTKEFMESILDYPRFMRSTRLYKFLWTTKNLLVSMARKMAPVKSRLLKSRIDGYIEGFGTMSPKIVYGVSNLRNSSGYNYGIAMEEGAKPHFIFPRRKRWLRWSSRGYRGPRVGTPPGVFGPPGLSETFRQFVHHPGNAPRPFIKPQLERVRPRFVAGLLRHLETFIKTGN